VFHDYLPTAESTGSFLGLKTSSTHVAARGKDSQNKPDASPKYTVPFELVAFLGALFNEAANNSCTLPNSKEAEKGRSICRFMEALTERSTTQADLFAQASTLLERLTIPPGIPEETCFYVPNHPARTLKGTLDAWRETAVTTNKACTDTELGTLISKGCRNTIKSIIRTQIELTKQDNNFEIEPLIKMHEELLDYQATIGSFESKLNNLALKAPDPVRDPLVFSTKDEDSIFEEDWKTKLLDNRYAEFCITVDKAMAKPLSYIREAR
jgi:hypothetical protein